MQPVLFDLGFFQIRYYGLMYAISLLVGLWMVEKEFTRKNYPFDSASSQNFVLFVFFVALLGSRLYYVLFSYGWYFSPGVPWWEFLAVWHGGLAIHGGILGGVFAIWLYTRKRKLSFLGLADVVVLPVMFGQSLGRIGNLMNGDAHGLPTDLPWGMVFHYGPAAEEFPGMALHPVMIYESLLNLLAFFILWSLRKKLYKDGFLAAIYLIFYSLIRSFVTQFRADDLYLWGMDHAGKSYWFFNQFPDLDWGIRAPHFISLVGVAVGFFLIFYYKLFQKNEPAHISSEKTTSKKK